MNLEASPPVDRAYDDRLPEAWYAVSPADRLQPGAIMPVDALGLALAAYRTSSGEVSIISRHCPHMGASLTQGRIEGDRIVCPFHGWEYGADGRCLRIPHASDDRIPKPAVLDVYPTAERGGWIWMYLGDCPAYPLPDELVTDPHPNYWNTQLTEEIRVHPLVLLENSTDPVHFRFTHRVDVVEERIEKIAEEPHRFTFRIHQRVREKNGHLSDKTTSFEYIGPNLILGRIEGDGREVAHFQIFPLPLGEGRCVHRVAFRVRRHEDWRRILDPLYVRFVGRRLTKGAALDIPLFEEIDPAARRCPVREDALQLRYQRYYLSHLPRD